MKISTKIWIIIGILAFGVNMYHLGVIHGKESKEVKHITTDDFTYPKTLTVTNQ